MQNRHMSRTNIGPTCALIIVLCSGATHATETPSEGSGAFATGKYRNLFVEIGYSAQEVTARIDRAFEQLFHGDPDTQAVYFPTGKNANGPLAYICDIHNNDVRSEGMSYGMMIAVQLDRKAEFDAIWNWAKTYMYHNDPNHSGYGYFSWSVKRDGKPNDEMPAPDGEEYFAMALYFASHRWGNGTGIYDYAAEADRLLTHMRHRRLITSPTVVGPRTAGGLFDPKHKMVRFTPDVDNRDHTDPSYHLPAFYELWALWGPKDDRSFWAEAARASRAFFQRVAQPQTALQLAEGFRLHNIAQGDHGRLFVGDFDAHQSLAGDGSLDANAACGERQCQVICQTGDLADFDLHRRGFTAYGSL